MVEPTIVYPENHFQAAIVAVIKDLFQRRGHRLTVLERFGLDIAIFDGSANGPRFIEVNAFGAQRMRGVGFGNGRGQGPQVDLLMLPDESLASLNATIRWICVDATQPVGARRYCLFDSRKAKQAAMGGVARGKQNNLRISAFREAYVDWGRLRSELEEFLLAKATTSAAG